MYTKNKEKLYTTLHTCSVCGDSYKDNFVAVDQNDMFADATYTWSASTWNDGNGLVWDSNCKDTYGEASTKSWMFGAASNITNNVSYQMFVRNPGYDMDGYYLVFEGKVVGAESQKIAARPHGGAGGWTDVAGLQFATLTEQWQTFILDFSISPWNTEENNNAYEQYGLSNIQRLNWTFVFSETTGDRRVIIDNARLVRKETVEEDWINMPIDFNDGKAAYQRILDMTVSEDSTTAMMIDTSEYTDLSLNTESYFGIDNLPNMKGGILSGYFYFGDQAPDAKIRLCDKGWNGGVSLSFSFEDLGDGWYFGSFDMEKYYFFASQIEAGASAKEIRRVKLQFPQNYLIYLDNLQYSPL